MLLFLSLLVSTLWQQPKLSKEIAGMWINQDPAAGGITQVVIIDRGGTFNVHAWAACTPRDVIGARQKSRLAKVLQRQHLIWDLR